MFKTDGSLFHPLLTKKPEALPEAFTFPFYYQPHKLSVIAANEVQSYLSSQTDFEHNFGLDEKKSGLKIGKMFGVMIVKNDSGVLGYLASFSGKLGESNYLNGFVPPIYDNLNPEGFYKKGEAHLNALNAEIENLETNADYLSALKTVERVKVDFETALKDYKCFIKSEKLKRKKKRVEAEQQLSQDAYENLLEELKKQSIFYHFRLKDLKRDWEHKITEAKANLESYEHTINQLKFERKTLSA
ncbi:MAG: RNA pseudouridine synthase, partial [Winogradskyella sp.]|nr:RNA pseudouridine synthase [Winogradskyella sp.]